MIYVDDILLICSDASKLEYFLKALQVAFLVRDLDQLQYFLGVEVQPTFDEIMLSQQKYISGLLTQFNMSNNKITLTPMATTLPLSKHGSDLLSNSEQFRQLIGSLQYVTLTRPDVAFTVNKLAQFMHQPTEKHSTVTKCLLCYLNGTTSMGLFFSNTSSMALQCFTNSDWAGCLDDQKFTSRYAIYLTSSSEF